MQKQKNYKRKYYALYRHIMSIVTYELPCDRCPISYMRKCCNGCKLIELRLKKFKNDTENQNDTD